MDADDLALFGHDLFGEVVKPKASGPVAERFTFPPFTILDAKQGEWQERKRAWIAMGISSDSGRTGLGDTCISAASYFNNGKTFADDSGSVFDPVLCELAYRWWCPVGGQIVDPFAGGSVRGIIAKALGYKYWGCDLRAEQIEANILQAETIFDGYDGMSGEMFGHGDLEWIAGDSMETLHTAPDADLLFTCPPYGDLEVYSDDPADISGMEWHTFLAAYKRIILRGLGRLKDDRFACIVVGDFRDKKGFYRNFVSETIAAFEECGARLYNEAILATPIGTACLRVTKQFSSGRKLAKVHQNVLVFCKGDWRKAADACNLSSDE